MLALWSTLCNMALNALFKGYTALTPLEALTRYWLGDYLGMLMFTLPALLWLRRDEPMTARPRLPRDGLLGSAAVVALFLISGMAQDRLSHQVLMSLMVCRRWCSRCCTAGVGPLSASCWPTWRSGSCCRMP